MAAVARAVSFSWLIAVCAGSARADQYWIAFEGDALPEEVGWTRFNFGDGPAERSIQDGIFRIDSRASYQISDYYQINREVNPAPGELFIAEWRMRSLENDGFSPDAEVVIAPDQEGTLGIGHYPDRLVSTREGWSEAVTAGIFHSYRIESTDMVQYSAYIDDQFVWNGQWDLNSLNRSFFAFGDVVRGVRSVSEWDYVRFGVIPEPSTSAVVLWLLRLAAKERQ